MLFFRVARTLFLFAPALVQASDMVLPAVPTKPDLVGAISEASLHLFASVPKAPSVKTGPPSLPVGNLSEHLLYFSLEQRLTLQYLLAKNSEAPGTQVLLVGSGTFPTPEVRANILRLTRQISELKIELLEQGVELKLLLHFCDGLAGLVGSAKWSEYRYAPYETHLVPSPAEVDEFSYAAVQMAEQVAAGARRESYAFALDYFLGRSSQWSERVQTAQLHRLFFNAAPGNALSLRVEQEFDCSLVQYFADYVAKARIAKDTDAAFSLGCNFEEKMRRFMDLLVLSEPILNLTPDQSAQLATTLRQVLLDLKGSMSPRLKASVRSLLRRTQIRLAKNTASRCSLRLLATLEAWMAGP
jgi:hypothetical protein